MPYLLYTQAQIETETKLFILGSLKKKALEQTHYLASYTFRMRTNESFIKGNGGENKEVLIQKLMLRNFRLFIITSNVEILVIF